MNSLTNRQMVMVLIISLTCYSIIKLPKVMAQSAGTGSWLSILVAALIFGLAAMLIVSLGGLFQGKMLFDYAPSLIGKVGTYIIVIFYVLYFMFILIYLITMKAKLLMSEFFPNTPLWAFPTIGIPVFCFIANKGITNIGRLSELIGLVFVGTSLFVHILITTQGQFNRILPLFDVADTKDYIVGVKDAMFSFLGIEVLLAIPITKINKKIKRTVFFAVLFIGLLYILIVESCIMKVGINNIISFDDPLIAAIRDTSPEFLDVFTRLDVLYLTIGFSAIFVGVSIVLAVIVEYLCRIFKKVKRQLIVTAVGILVFIQFMIYKDISHYKDFVEQVGQYLGIVASMLIPGVFFIIAKIKKVKVRGKKDAL